MQAPPTHVPVLDLVTGYGLRISLASSQNIACRAPGTRSKGHGTSGRLPRRFLGLEPLWITLIPAHCGYGDTRDKYLGSCRGLFGRDVVRVSCMQSRATVPKMGVKYTRGQLSDCRCCNELPESYQVLAEQEYCLVYPAYHVSIPARNRYWCFAVSGCLMNSSSTEY